MPREKGFCSHRFHDNSIYRVQITRDGKRFASIIFLQYGLSASQLKERDALVAPVLHITPKIPKNEEGILRLRLDQHDHYTDLLTHALLHHLTAALNHPQADRNAKPQSRWISRAPGFDSDILRLERNFGKTDSTPGFGRIPFADISFASAKAKMMTKAAMPAALGALIEWENKHFEKVKAELENAVPAETMERVPERVIQPSPSRPPMQLEARNLPRSSRRSHLHA